jgi:hypothetical protein
MTSLDRASRTGSYTTEGFRPWICVFFPISIDGRDDKSISLGIGPLINVWSAIKKTDQPGGLTTVDTGRVIRI